MGTNETNDTRTGTLESRIRRLEEIAGELEREDVELDDALALFEEGIAHLREAKALIARTDLRIERLVADLDGGTRLEAVEDDS
jgi:exodeoxyribonuclease VII small subunit